MKINDNAKYAILGFSLAMFLCIYAWTTYKSDSEIRQTCTKITKTVEDYTKCTNGTKRNF